MSKNIETYPKVLPTTKTFTTLFMYQQYRDKLNIELDFLNKEISAMEKGAVGSVCDLFAMMDKRIADGKESESL